MTCFHAFKGGTASKEGETPVPSGAIEFIVAGFSTGLLAAWKTKQGEGRAGTASPSEQPLELDEFGLPKDSFQTDSWLLPQRLLQPVNSVSLDLADRMKALEKGTTASDSGAVEGKASEGVNGTPSRKSSADHTSMEAEVKEELVDTQWESIGGVRLEGLPNEAALCGRDILVASGVGYALAYPHAQNEVRVLL